MADEPARHLGSPNRVTCEYFSALRRLVLNASRAATPDVAKQDTALSIMVAVTVVEAFVNLFFRVRVSEPSGEAHASSVLRDLKERKSLSHKLERWPERVLGTPLHKTAPAVIAFMELKDRRNALVHFTSTHETIPIEGFTLQGVADTTVYDGLTHEDAVDALAAAENMVAELLKLAGYSAEEIPLGLHLWLGKVPDQA